MTRYLIRNPLAKSAFFLSDMFLSLFFRPRVKKIKNTPKKILINNNAHLGDVVIATAVLPILKKAFPDCKIGFLIGSWSYPVLANHPMIDYIHTVDHWKLNRADISFWEKYKIYSATRKKALAEVLKISYDAAIDLYHYFPNMIPFLFRAGIPVRIGYSSGGFGSLLSHVLPWKDTNRYLSAYHTDLLKLLRVEASQLALPCLDPISHKISRNSSSPVPDSRICEMPIKLVDKMPKEYFVLHVGAGHPLKEWPEEKWKLLVWKLLSKGYFLVFTGKGKKERKKISLIIKNTSNCLNLADEISWKEFVYVVRKANLLVAADSVAVHVASGFNISTISLFCGINNLCQWTPPKNCKALMAPVDCYPCNKKRGCRSMGCLRDLPVEEVYREILLRT